MPTHTLRKRLQDGETSVGTIQVVDSPQVSEAIGVAGMDFVIFDQEHGPLTAETSLAMAAAAQVGGTEPIVRVRTNAEHEIQRALDIGSAGVMIPQVETQADAKAAVNAARFAPLGERGLSQYVRAGEYAGMNEYTKRQNEETTLIVQIEGKRGVENVQEIVAVEGIDVIFLGPYDISSSLGIPGQVHDSEVRELMAEVCDVAANSETIVGTFADDTEMAQQWIEAGAQFVAIGVAAAHLTWQLESVVDAIDR